MSINFVSLHTAIRAWIVGGSQLPLSKVYWGGQDAPRIAEPAIEMRLHGSKSLGIPWLDTETIYLTFSPLTVTGISVGSNTLTIPSHGFGTGDGPVRFSTTGTLYGGVALATNYWVIKVDANTIKVATSYVRTGGADINGSPSGNTVTPVDLTSTSADVITVIDTATTLRAGQETRNVSRSMERLVLDLECHTTDAIGMNAAMSILSRIKARQKLPSQQAILKAAHLGLTDVERPRAIHGVRNAVMFEPRAIMEVYFSLPTEEEEPGTIMERADINDSESGFTVRVNP